MSVYLQDGRIIVIPLKLFPSIARLTLAQRTKYTIGDGEVIVFQDADEVYHIEQFLGHPDDYQYNFS